MDSKTITAYVKQIMELEISLHRLSEAKKTAQSTAIFREPKKTHIEKPVNTAEWIKKPEKPQFVSHFSLIVGALLFCVVFVGIFIFTIMNAFAGFGFFITIIPIVISALLAIAWIDSEKKGKDEYIVKSIQYEKDIEKYIEDKDKAEQRYKDEIEKYQTKVANEEKEYQKNMKRLRRHMMLPEKR